MDLSYRFLFLHFGLLILKPFNRRIIISTNHMEDRKDNRLLSGLIDLKLCKGESQMEEVFLLWFRGKGNPRNWELFVPSTTTKFTKTSWKSSRKKQPAIRLSSSRALKITSPSPTSSKTKNFDNYSLTNSNSAKCLKDNTWWNKILWPAPFSFSTRENWQWK